MKRMRYAVLLCVSLLLLVGCARQTRVASKTKITEGFIAVAHNCPPDAVMALEKLCDKALELSGGTLRLALQYWENPLTAQADLLFAGTDVLARETPSLKALSEDLLFLSDAIADDALNASSVLSAMTDAWENERYEALNSFYGGRVFLLSQDNVTAKTMRSADRDELRVLVKNQYRGLGAFESPFIPANATHLAALSSAAKPDEHIYTAQSDSILALNETQRNALFLIDIPYRYQFSVLWADTALSETWGRRHYASLCEAIAYAKPACMNAFQKADAQVLKTFQNALIAPARLSQAIRDERFAMDPPIPAINTPLFQLLDRFNP